MAKAQPPEPASPRPEESDPEAALRDSEARLALATEAAEIGIWDWDLASGRMVYSPRAKAISGFGPDEEVTIDKVRAIVHPEDHPRTWAMAARALDPALREHTPYEYRVVLPDGSLRWVLAHGEAVFEETDGEARAVRYVGTIQDVTGRHDLEAAREASEQRLRLAIDAGRMAVWEVDVKRDRLVGAPELNRLLGFPEDRILDIEEVRAGYYPGERERLQALGQELMAKGERFMEAEYRYIRPDGAVRWMMLRAEMLYDPEGAPDRAVGVLMDVTGRKRTEEALRTSEARLKIALQAAGAGVFEWDVVTGRLEWSPELYALYGIDPDQAGDDLHAAWRGRLHPDDVELADAIGRRALETGASFSNDFRIVGPDGAVRWIRAHGTVVTDGAGQPATVTGINVDVTAQHEAQESLRARAEETERQRDRIYELSNDLFAVASFDGYLKVVNPAWSRVLGYGGEELLKAEFIDRIHPDDRARTAETVGMLRHGRHVRHFENRLLHADGGSVWVSWSAVAEGNAFYVVGRDVTREKEREEALRQAQKMEAVGQLTGGIAHDFNNLLQAMYGNFDLIRRRAGEEKLRRWAENGLEAADRGAKLTAQLLSFSRAQKPELKPVPAARLIEGMEELLARTLGPMVRVELDMEPGTGSVIADPTQLEMALLNLAINARDAMPEGGTLSIGARRRQEPGDADLEPGEYLAIEVSDSGEGMDADVAGRAFDPFFTTKEVGKGTGLGLSQVYGMARQAGGAARLASRPGEGTTVTLLLRRTDARPEEAEAKASARDEQAKRTARVLVVDDDGDVRRFLADTLGDLGYEVVEADCGEAAIRVLDELRPDLMIVDYAMPAMSGAKVADAARERHPDLPIIFASGYADTGAIEAAAGPDAVLLRKPFRIDELEATLSACLPPVG